MSEVGGDPIGKMMRLYSKQVLESAALGTQAAGEEIRFKTIKRTPLDNSPLRDSLYVSTPSESWSESSSNEYVTTIGSRGAVDPDTGFKYAVVQHEDMSFKHAYGEAKFLENTVNANTKRFVQLVKKYIKLGFKRPLK